MKKIQPFYTRIQAQNLSSNLKDKIEVEQVALPQYNVPNYRTQNPDHTVAASTSQTQSRKRTHNLPYIYNSPSETVTTVEASYDSTYPIHGIPLTYQKPSPYDRLNLQYKSTTTPTFISHSQVNHSSNQTISNEKQVNLAQLNFAESEKDMDYMKQLYPKTAKKILNLIESECDRLDYNGSCIYDEYPDRVTLDRIIDKLYDSIPLDEHEVALEIQNHPHHHHNNDLLRDLITIILLNEVQHRRRRRCHGRRGCRY